MILKWLRRIFGGKKKESEDIDILLEKVEEEKKAMEEIQRERNVRYLEGLTWSAFRSHHKGTPVAEISKLWQEYKDGTYKVRDEQ
jgi:hypothetical protein|tara:strand:- start:374 stop:628 length:255 start_codon:yes stop_codon:yes gene_type:complete